MEPDLPRALTYLQAAARNSAAVEEQALAAGMKKGGSAKGELVLAIFELGNCFRHAWGVGKDPVAAREYYETAANLGDADAQNEVAWCYVEGFGCKKDKVSHRHLYSIKFSIRTLSSSELVMGVIYLIRGGLMQRKSTGIHLVFGFVLYFSTKLQNSTAWPKSKATRFSATVGKDNLLFTVIPRSGDPGYYRFFPLPAVYFLFLFPVFFPIVNEG